MPEPQKRRTRLIAAGLLACLALTTVAAPVMAGRIKAPSTSSTLALVLLDGGDGTANRGERAAFNVSTTATTRPFVGVRCYQSGNFVLDGYTGYFDSYIYDPWVTLDSPYWDASAPADCTARLFYYDKRGNQKVIATLGFTAQP
jgi:hypothetical protein